MEGSLPVQSRRRFDRPFAEILEERWASPPKDPAEAAASFVYALARALLMREARADRAEQAVRDFEEASSALILAATRGATWGEQAEILQEFWERFELPEQDLRKRREVRGPTDAQLRREFEKLHRQLVPILRHRKKKPLSEVVRRVRELAPWATPKKLDDAAKTGPVGAAHVLLGSRYHLGRATIRNRISRAKNRT